MVLLVLQEQRVQQHHPPKVQIVATTFQAHNLNNRVCMLMMVFNVIVLDNPMMVVSLIVKRLDGIVEILLQILSKYIYIYVYLNNIFNHLIVMENNGCVRYRTKSYRIQLNYLIGNNTI